jgi:hypothetical protein
MQRANLDDIELTYIEKTIVIPQESSENGLLHLKLWFVLFGLYKLTAA